MMRIVYTGVGLICLGFGMVGVFTPLLPTTPFLLLAAFCFSRGSKRLHDWLLAHRVFGPMIGDWERGHVIRRKVKWLATVMLLAMVSYPLCFKPLYPVTKIIVAIVVGSVLAFIWSCPAEHREERNQG